MDDGVMDRSRGLHGPAHPRLALNLNKSNHHGAGAVPPVRARSRTAACRCYREMRTEKMAVSELGSQPDDDVCFHVISTAVSVLLLGK